MSSSYEDALWENLEAFLEHWGPISWRTRIGDVQGVELPAISGMLGALAGIEDDAFYMQTKLQYSGAARLDPVKQFNAVWLVEEADHGRALAALAEKFHGPRPIGPQAHSTFRRDRRALTAIPKMRALRPYTRGVLAVYLTTGTLVEFVAITTYTALAQMINDPAARDILLQMTRQEGRHMRFYRRSAIAVLEDDKNAQRFVRWVMRTHWLPPGVELYGYTRWIKTFKPLIADKAIRARYLKMDKLLSELPGQEGIQLMHPFLARCLPALGHADLGQENNESHSDQIESSGSGVSFSYNDRSHIVSAN